MNLPGWKQLRRVHELPGVIIEWYRWVSSDTIRVLTPSGVITIPEGLYHQASESAYIDAAGEQGRTLQYEHDWRLVVDMNAIRQIIKVAQYYDDEEIALIAVMASMIHFNEGDEHYTYEEGPE